MTKAIFILVFSITSGGSTIEGQVEQSFATRKECMAEREKLLEAHRKTFSQGAGDSIMARCKQVKQ
ncbi:hypothetical protein [Taklimakanibacter lacteus]|uniref:hypothetical protein n=1 Tax=Taklimakanibacter lacteus TaxID=2268456 RepID=UPI000E6736ED